MPQWLSNFSPGIKIKRLKLNIQRFQLGNIKKLNSPGAVDFPPGSKAKIMSKESRDSIKRVATLAKIQISREASHHLTLMGNYQTLYSLVFVFV